MIPACLGSMLVLALSREVSGKPGMNLRGLQEQEPENSSNVSVNGPIMSAGGSNLSLGTSAAWPSALSEYTMYYNYNCYDGHGGGGGDNGFVTTLESCASYSDSCFVWMWDQNLCFPRTWCHSYPPTGCEYDATESFATYVKSSGSSPTRRRRAQYAEYAHSNCYEGHGGSHSDEGFYATRDECASYNKPCYVYLSSQSKCFLRDWCNSNANGCEYGTPGTESWYFSTYIRTWR